MNSIPFSGKNFIDGSLSGLGNEQVFAHHPESDQPMEPGFSVATPGEVEAAGKAAAAAAAPFAAIGADQRAGFLDAVARHIEELGDSLIERASAESGLPIARLTGERGRTCGQLRLFANVVREGSWVDARIETADPARAPLPKPDIRRMLLPLGPVAVFGASNFPLAFSIAGGDTASAFAAGCPVIAKAHHAQPGTADLVAGAIVAAVKETGMPSGTFGLLQGGAEVGRNLVLHPDIEAVAFTGSLSVGKSLFDLAASRPRPIPVFAEMGSVNPVFVLPGALEDRFDSLVSGYSDSLNLGVGQFCTNPGLLIGVDGPQFRDLLAAIADRLAKQATGVMLHRGILCRYNEEVLSRIADGRLSHLAGTPDSAERAHAAFFSTSGAQFLAGPDLLTEVFGPAGLAVACESVEQLIQVAAACGGQLTSTLQFVDGDRDTVQKLLPILAKISGRVLANGYPTGVEVCSAMQHGGPFPATTDTRSTSVGTAAIFRFARPVAYQNIPEDLLPVELQSANPRKIMRMLNGELTRDAIPGLA